MQTSITKSMLSRWLDSGCVDTAISEGTMNTENVMPMYEKVIHIAYGCGCVETFHVEHNPTEVKCHKHGDGILATTEELVLKTVAA